MEVLFGMSQQKKLNLKAQTKNEIGFNLGATWHNLA
jgi:hypothetical protein